MRNGVMTTRWVQTRERNESLDLVCMTLCCALTYRGAIDSMEPQVVGDAPASTQAQAAAALAPSRTQFGVLPGSERLAAQLGGVSPQVVRERDPSQRRPWGVQPSHNIWDL
jgi:hypothetical protein